LLKNNAKGAILVYVKNLKNNKYNEKIKILGRAQWKLQAMMPVMGMAVKAGERMKRKGEHSNRSSASR
jgi:hypothetical protein